MSTRGSIATNLLFEGKQGMGMMEELSLAVSHHIAVDGDQFEHAFQVLCLEASFFGDEHLQLCALAASDAGEDCRGYRFLLAYFEQVGDNLVAPVHADVVVFAYFSVIHIFFY